MKEKINNFAERVYAYLQKKLKNKSNNQILEDFKLLYPGKELPGRVKDYYLEKIRLGIFILLGSGLLIGILWINEQRNEVIGDNLLYRKEYGEGQTEIELWVRNQNEEIPITVTLEEREYTKEELDQLFLQFEAVLETQILGNNVSFEQISFDLNLSDQVEGYPFSIDWYTDNYFLDRNGHLLQQIPEAESVSEIRADIFYKDYLWQKVYQCKIRKPAIEEDFIKKLSDFIQQEEEQTRNSKALELPQFFEENPIYWRKRQVRQSVMLFFGVPVLLIILSFCKDYDVHEKVKKRQDEMEYDYPEVVNKLALYIGAGMTVQNAWNRIIMDYQGKKQVTRYVYEEMIFAYREVENGTSFEKALEGFGRRCQSAKYMKLVTLLSQYLKKGSIQIGALLRQEATEAMEERKNVIRKKGEKAGTEMLVPMMLLLFVIMILVVAPAFMNQLKAS